MHENLSTRKRKVTMPRGNRSKRENYLSRKILNYAFDIDIPENNRLSRDTTIMLKNELCFNIKIKILDINNVQ